MKYRVIVSDNAKTQLAEHISFLAQVSKPAARSAKLRIINELRSLEEMPQRFPFLDVELLPRNKYHKMYVENFYLVLYQIKDQNVFVEQIIDCRKDYQWLKK